MIGMSNIARHALVGGKTGSRIIYMQYNDSAAVEGHRVAKLKWPVADSKPTYISSTTVQNLIDIIEAANPSITVDYGAGAYNQLLLIGSSDYGSVFATFRDTSDPHVRYIAEIGSSHIETEESSSSSIPEASGWKFLRLIDYFDYTSETNIKFIDVVDDEVYITAGSEMVESSYLGDDFTGLDGSAPNSKKWNITSGSPDIQNNKLELTQIGLGTADHVTTTYMIGGDYDLPQVDIAVDFELINYGAVESWGIDLVLNYYKTKTDVAYVRFGYWGGQYGYQLGYYDSSWHTIDSMIGSSPDTSGKLRIVARMRRSEGMITGYTELRGYYWNGSDWTLIAEHDEFRNSYAYRIINISLRVDNSNASQNVTWRADNFTVKSGFNVYAKTYVYERDSYNSSTKQFETLLRSKNLNVCEAYAVTAGTDGMAVSREKNGWYWDDQPHEMYTDLASYDKNLDEVAVSALRAEYHLGELCDWQRDIYYGDNWFEGGGPYLVCGNYPNALFTIGTLIWLNGDDTYLALIEIDGTTLKPTRASLLQTTNTEFDGSEIQDALDVP